MRRRVLLVDDEPDVRAVARLCLERVGGWEVVEATSGAEAVVAAQDGGFDAVLLDVMMPGLDGPGTFLRLQADARTADLPVVLLTARVERPDRERWLELGIRGVLAKPFDPMRLSADIADLLGWNT